MQSAVMSVTPRKRRTEKRRMPMNHEPNPEARRAFCGRVDSVVRRVYRVQDTRGRGPWRPGFSRRWVEERDDHKALKSWIEEFPDLRTIAAPSTYYGCGCETLRQLRRWFTESEYQTLLSLGYRCVRLDIDRILASGPTQCVFVRHRALRKGAILIDLYA